MDLRGNLYRRYGVKAEEAKWYQGFLTLPWGSAVERIETGTRAFMPFFLALFEVILRKV